MQAAGAGELATYPPIPLGALNARLGVKKVDGEVVACPNPPALFPTREGGVIAGLFRMTRNFG